MKDQSTGLLLAWQIAAGETAYANFEFIEKEQLLIGILSLKKLANSSSINMRMKSSDFEILVKEYESIKKILQKFNTDSTKLRRIIRLKLGQGNFKHNEKVIHRSEKCKEYFLQAESLTDNSDKISSLHLFNAILEEPGDVVKSALNELNIDIDKLKKRVKLYINILKKSDMEDSYVI